MNKDITIPREARSAGADVVRGSEASTWEEVAEETFLAMLKAWPNKREDGTRIILPLPKKEPEA